MDIVKLMEQAAKRMGEAETEIAKAREANDEKALAKAEVRFEIAESEFNELKAKSEAAKVQAERQAAIDEAKAAMTPAKTVNHHHDAGKAQSVESPATDPQAKAIDDAFNKMIAKKARVVESRAKADFLWLDAFGKMHDDYKSVSEEEKNRLSLTYKTQNTDLQGLMKNSRMAIFPQFMVDIISGTPEIAKGGLKYLHTLHSKVNTLSIDTSGYSTDSGTGLTIPDGYFNEYQKEPVFQPRIADRCYRVPAGTGKYFIPIQDNAAGEYGGVVAQWQANADEGTDMDEKRMFSNKVSGITDLLYIFVPVQMQAINRTQYDYEAEVLMAMRGAATKELSRVVLKGNSSNIEGIIGYTGVTGVPRDVNNEVSYGDLNTLRASPSLGFRQNAIYTLADTAEAQLWGTVDNDGRPLYSENVGSAFTPRLLNREYINHDYASPVLGEAGDVVFGDYRYYALGIEKDMAIDMSEHVYFKRAGLLYRLLMWAGGKPIFGNAFATLNANA
jgi:HK97 family phage major capsid protein